MTTTCCPDGVVVGRIVKAAASPADKPWMWTVLAAIFETDSKATTTPVAPAVPRVFAFFHAGGAVNRR
jgi:hypothetical protein